MPSLDLLDQLGRPVLLGKELGKGGEGSVFDLVNMPDAVAKVYHQPLSQAKQEKLRAMTVAMRKELLAVAAWPTGTLHQGSGGPIRGFVMRKVKDAKDVHFLYSPAHRKVTFPEADWRFLTHTAMNCAAAFDTLHSFGVVVGDVNQSNVFVSADAMTALVDCDSFQIATKGRSYLCDVGVDLFTPPELQGRHFGGIERSANHDNFGLAVLIFYLLFVGRHPFAGRYLANGDMPISQAISEHRFAFGRSANTYLMQPPPQAPTIGLVSTELANLFELAFGPGSTQPNGRPTPRQWVSALKSFKESLRVCNSDPGHFYGPHLSSCPWCNLMAQGAPNFFISVAYSLGPGGHGGIAFSLGTVWARIDAVSRPTANYVRPSIPPASGQTPWPAGVGRAMLPRPLPPGILRSPPSGPGVPAKPVAPAILSSPPEPPTIEVEWPSRERLRRTPSQTTTGLSAIGGGLLCVVLLVFGGVLGLAGNSRSGVVVALLGIAPLAVLIGFGLWWLVQESNRKESQRAFDREYESELFARRVEADRQLEVWKRDLAERQATARKRFQQVVRRWENEIAVLQTDARREYDLEVARWKESVERMQAEAQRRRNAAEEARNRLEKAEREWKAVASQSLIDFDKKKSELSRLRDRHEQLGREYVIERQQLHSRVREFQLTQFLQQVFISDHKIPDIGRGRLATLSSFGIETALDVDDAKVRNVPGFGDVLTARLVEWRRNIEQRFAFDPAAGVPKQQQQALDAKYSQERQRIEMSLLSGERELKAIVANSEAQLAGKSSAIRASLGPLAQANTDLALIPAGL
jgi:DNA-binding helix-hairpin-helix protein with protein kinase domain